MAYWLMKSEPYTYSWQDLLQAGCDHWDGIRNYQARNNLKAMQVGDKAFLYHSNEGKDVVGVMEIVGEAYPDHTFTPPAGKDNPWVMVDVAPLKSLPYPVSLAEVKANPKLADMPLVKSQRLSVQPVTPEHWREVLRMGGVESDTDLS